MKNPYNPFGSLTVRIPLFPLELFTSIFDKDKEKLTQNVIQLIENKFFCEAIYLASPDLYYEIEKWTSIQPIEKNEKLLNTIIKYIIRISTRSTPFGLFAGVGVKKFSKDDTSFIINNNFDNFDRKTRLDMNYMTSLAHSLTKNRSLAKEMK